MIKVMVADDQELIRQSLQIVLNSKTDIEVIEKTGSVNCQSLNRRLQDALFYRVFRRLIG